MYYTIVAACIAVSLAGFALVAALIEMSFEQMVLKNRLHSIKIDMEFYKRAAYFRRHKSWPPAKSGSRVRNNPDEDLYDTDTLDEIVI